MKLEKLFSLAQFGNKGEKMRKRDFREYEISYTNDDTPEYYFQSVQLCKPSDKMLTVKAAVILVFCFETTASHGIHIPDGRQDSCLKRILSELFQDVDSLTISWSRRINDGMRDDISKILSNKMKFISDRQFEAGNEAHIDRRPGAVLIVASTKVEIDGQISSLHSNIKWSVTPKVIVLYLGESGNERKSALDPFFKDVFQTFANLDALNVQLIYEFDGGINEFTWFPYEDSNCGTVDRVRLIGECGFRQNYSEILRKTLKTNNSQSRCTITAAVQSSEPYSFYSRQSGFTKGIDIDLVKGLARWSHFNLELRVANNIFNYSGAANLSERYVDIVIGASNEFRKNSSQSIDFHFDDLTWCVKKADLIQAWRSFFLFATWQVWTIAAIGIYVTAFTVFAFFTHHRNPQNFHYCTGVAFLTFLAIPVPYHPTHGIARIHFGILLFYGLLAVISINCYLTSMMTKPQYQYQTRTTDELMRNEYKILVDVESVSLYYLGNDKVSSYTKANYNPCNGTQCLNRLFERSKLAAIVPRTFANHFESTAGHTIFCFAKSESFNKVTRTLSCSNSYLLKKINRFILRAMETGHLLKWERDVIGSLNYESDLDAPIVLTVQHLSAALLIYAVAITIASLTLVITNLVVNIRTDPYTYLLNVR